MSRYVFWLSGIGFSFGDRRLSSLVAGKFSVILRYEVGIFQQSLQDFSGNQLPPSFPFDGAVDKVFHQNSGIRKFCCYVQMRLGHCACLLRWPILYFIKF